MRIKLDLSEFLEDERKFSVVKVNVKETRTVRDVLIKIGNLFNVTVGIEGSDEEATKKPTLGLFEDEFYIHPDQTSAVLQDTGVLKLKSLPKSERSGTGKKKKKIKRDPIEEDSVAKDVSERKEKKIKKSKTEDELQQIQNDINKEDKKEKRGSRISEEPPFPKDEDDSNRKARKRKRARTLEEVGGQETGDLEQRSKVSRTSEEKSESEDELMMRQEVKSKKAKLGETLVADREEDVEEMHSKRKGKKSRLKGEEGEATEEVEEVSVSKKKKSRREKVSELPFSSELIVEEKRKKKSSEFSMLQEHKTSRKKVSKNLVVEELHKTQTQPHAEMRKSKSREEKSSQEKVVSTSTIINLESEDVSEDSYSSPQSIGSYQGQQHIQDKTVGCNSKHFVVDSLTDPQVADDSLFSERKRRRKRKHKKKDDSELHEKEGSTISGVPGITVEKYGKPSTSTDLPQSLNYQWPSNNQRPLLNSNFTRKHVRFTSDDEGLVREKEIKPSQDIEIVETTTTTGEDGFQASAGISPSYQWGNKSKSQSPDSWPPFTAKATRGRNVPHITSSQRNIPVDLEAEKYEENDIFLSRHKSPQALSKTPTSSSSNFDELATLRRICENKTITVCKVDSRKEQTRPRAKETPTSSPAPPPYLSPPSPLLPSPKRTNEETRQTFHNIMAMQNNPSPIFSSNPRQVVHVEDSDTSYPRHRGPQNYVQDINVKSTSKLHPSDSRKANGEELPVSLSAHNVLPRSSTTQQQMYGQQVGQRGEMSQISQQGRNEGWKETRTTKLLSSIINETTKRGSMTPQPRPREAPKRMQQSLGAVLPNFRDQDGGNTEVDVGELEILGNNSSAYSTPGRDSNLNRQLLVERLAKPLEPLPNVQSPGTSRRFESPARAANQKKSMSSPLLVESEVVDLESEEEIEIPVAKSMELGTLNNMRNLSGRTPPSELEKITKKPMNDSIPGLDSPKEAPLRTDRVDNRKSSPSLVAEIIEDRLSSSCVPEGDQQEDLIVADDLECKDISPESELIDDDDDDEGDDEELEVEEEEREEIGVEEDEEEIGLEEEEEGAELDAEVIDDEISDIYDDLDEKKEDRASINDNAAAQENIELKIELSSRLKESLEKFSQSSTKTRSGSENVMNVNTKGDSEIIIGMNTNLDCENGTSNINSKNECERTMDAKASLNSKKVINVAGKSQGDTREMGNVAEIQDVSGKEPITSQESGTPNMEIEELVTKNMEEKTPEEGSESLMEHDQCEEREPSEEWFRQHMLIKNPPKEGQYIAVKLENIDESMCPNYSNYRQARVMRVQGSRIHLKFVDKIKPKQKTGKEFEEVDLTHEEVDLTEDLEEGETVEEMDWRDIHEPRLLQP